jgi:hypothetical protein
MGGGGQHQSCGGRIKTRCGRARAGTKRTKQTGFLFFFRFDEEEERERAREARERGEGGRALSPLARSLSCWFWCVWWGGSACGSSGEKKRGRSRCLPAHGADKCSFLEGTGVRGRAGGREIGVGREGRRGERERGAARRSSSSSAREKQRTKNKTKPNSFSAAGPPGARASGPRRTRATPRAPRPRPAPPRPPRGGSSGWPPTPRCCI